MAICATSCAATVPSSGADFCKVVTRGAGISRVIYSACDHAWVDFTDLGEWTTEIGNNKISYTGKIIGTMPEGSETLKRLASCATEQVVGMSRSVTIEDYNADTSGNTDYDFWNEIMSNSEKYHVGFLTCDGLLYGANAADLTLIQNQTTIAKKVIPDNVNDHSYWSVTINWEGLTLDKPISVPGLDAILV